MQKIVDTYYVFAGEISPDMNSWQSNGKRDLYKRVHFGIFDYLTLGIFFAIHALLRAFADVVKSPGFLVWCAIVLYQVLYIPRLIFSVAMTVLCTPLVALVHIFTHPEGDLKKLIIKEQEVTSGITKLKMASDVPTDLWEYRDSYFYSYKHDVLYYVTMEERLTKVTIINPKEFKQKYAIDKVKSTGHKQSFNLSKQELLQLVNKDDLKHSYYTIGSILSEKGIEIENLATSYIEVQDNNVSISLYDDSAAHVKTLFFDLTQVKDRAIINQLAELNISEVEMKIETTAPKLLTALSYDM